MKYFASSYLIYSAQRLFCNLGDSTLFIIRERLLPTRLDQWNFFQCEF